MNNWFYNPSNHFQLFSTVHFMTVAFLIFLVVILYLFRKQLAVYRDAICMIAGLLLIVSFFSLYFWFWVTGTWNLRTSLPFNLSSIATVACGVMLLAKSRFLFEVFYVIAIGSAAPAILTPDLAAGFPQFRYFQFFIDHFLILVAPLILCWLYDFTITKMALFKSLVVLHGIAFVVFFIDWGFSANYMFLMHKPVSKSLLDYLGTYPYYLLSLESVTWIMYGLLYLPFGLSRKDV